MAAIPPDYLHKKVIFRWNRQELELSLSHGLFSSFDVDSGSRLLLKSLVKTVDFDALESVLDVGCGIGVLGAAVKKRSPRIRLVMQDRDALAVAVSRFNCERNAIADADVRGSLALTGLGDSKFDLILSNFPAKAGLPVLKAFVSGSSRFLTENGRTAMVIVLPLAETVEQAIQASEGTLLHVEKNTQYAVFHFRTPPRAFEHGLPVYLRARSDFTLADRTFQLDTVFGLAEFDTPGYRHLAAAAALKGFTASGNVLFWSPGQGQIPVFLASAMKRQVSQATGFYLAGNDLLELETAGRNIEELHPGLLRSTHHLPFETVLTEVFRREFFDSIIVDLNPVPGVHWHKRLSETAGFLLKKDGKLILTGKTAFLTLFEKDRQTFRSIDGAKFRGFRTSLLKKLL